MTEAKYKVKADTNMTPMKLFIKSLVISATTVGGGFVVISVIRSLFVEKLKLISEDELLEMASLAQSAPGSISININFVVGYRLCGVMGAFAAVVGALLPPLVIMSIIAAIYGLLGNFRENETIANIMTGMQAGVSAVVLDAAYGMTASVIREKNILRIAVFVCAMVLQLVFSVSSIYIILGALTIGIVSTVIKTMRGKNAVH